MVTKKDIRNTILNSAELVSEQFEQDIIELGYGESVSPVENNEEYVVVFQIMDGRKYKDFC